MDRIEKLEKVVIEHMKDTKNMISWLVTMIVVLYACFFGTWIGLAIVALKY